MGKIFMMYGTENRKQGNFNECSTADQGVDVSDRYKDGMNFAVTVLRVAQEIVGTDKPS